MQGCGTQGHWDVGLGDVGHKDVGTQGCSGAQGRGT